MRLSAAVKLLSLAAVFSAAVFGQVRFEVASIKPTAGPDGRSLLQATPGRLAMTNLALRRMILIAYDVQDYQLAEVPGWVDSGHYDVEAKAEGNPSIQQMEGPMLRRLLEERFHLAIHRETRQLPVYTLSIAKTGPKLQPSKEGACIPYETDAPPPRTATTPPNFCGLHIASNGAMRTLDGQGVTMAALAANLSRTYTTALGRNVIDQTGLTRTFDVHLQWATDAAPADTQIPSIFTALQEQTGLKLESGKGPVEVLVIDRIEKPSGN